MARRRRRAGGQRIAITDHTYSYEGDKTAANFGIHGGFNFLTNGIVLGLEGDVDSFTVRGRFSYHFNF